MENTLYSLSVLRAAQGRKWEDIAIELDKRK
jgi:hypothetical protein